MIERAFQRRTLPLADFGEIGLHGEIGIQKKKPGSVGRSRAGTYLVGSERRLAYERSGAVLRRQPAGDLRSTTPMAGTD